MYFNRKSHWKNVKKLKKVIRILWGEIKMDFGEAIKLLKKGKNLQREGWNGKNQYT